MPSRVYTIAAGTPFLEVLASGLLQRHGGGPAGLGGITVLLPTRRACRALTETFLRIGGGQPMLLPALRPIGDVDEIELLLAGATSLALPPAIPPLRRQLLLARLVARRPGFRDPAQAALLAAELAALLDEVATERLDFAGLDGLAPESFAAHWQLTLGFLKILTEAWPAVLADEGALDPADRRNRLLVLEAERWRQAPAQQIVYAAGSTGSIPATADLLRVIADRPQGAVILPGLDLELDDASWAAAGAEPAHPQFGLHRLLTRLAVERQAVAAWTAAGGVPASRPRLALLREAQRPAATTHRWASLPAELREGLAGLHRVDAPGPREEALCIALLLREVLEQPGQRAALVTPDRALARRVAAELARWHIEIDDSAGLPLSDTPPGSLLRLAGRMLLEAVAPVPLLAALKHPLAAGGQRPDRFRRRVRRLERRVLRGPRPAAGFPGVREALLAAGAADDLVPWLDQIAHRAEHLSGLIGADRADPQELLRAHVEFTAWLAGAEGDKDRLWAGEAGAALAELVHELEVAAAGMEPIAGFAWPALLDALMVGRVVRPAYGRHPRLAVWSPLEARLQQPDLLVLGGLNEGTWPAESGAEPWLSRPMRARFGLPPLERRIGLAAHDFQQLAAAPRVVLTRSLKVEGTPTVPSRWLLRLEAVLRGLGKSLDRGLEASLLAWAAELDRPAAVRPAAPPAPRPPVALRPRRLSVTRVETWIRDPYAIYARQILKLQPLEPLDADPGAAERGSIIHAALEDFVRSCPEDLPADAAQKLEAIGRKAFGRALLRPGVQAFWWPRFLAAGQWFLERERERRARGIRPLATECTGTLSLPGPEGPFQLTAKADRIDRLGDGRLAVIDYKTGQPPTQKQIESGLVPQLPLEAAIAAAGGFEGVPAVAVGELLHIRLRGGSEPGALVPVDGEPAALAAAAVAGLLKLIAAFDDPETPYLSRPRPQFEARFSDYDHLARVAEWSAGPGGDI